MRDVDNKKISTRGLRQTVVYVFEQSAAHCKSAGSSRAAEPQQSHPELSPRISPEPIADVSGSISTPN
jgi:hypothetical protein